MTCAYKKEAQLFKCRDFNCSRGFSILFIEIKREYNGLEITISFLLLDYQTNFLLMKSMTKFLDFHLKIFKLIGVTFEI